MPISFSVNKQGIGELVLIFCIAWGVGLYRYYFPAKLEVGELVMQAAALVFAQSLIRDVWILFQQRKKSAKSTGEQSRQENCICLESAVGAVILLIGGILFFRFDAVVSPSFGLMSVLVFGLLIVGFLIKNWVVVLYPLSISYEPNHLNVLVFARHKT